MLKFQYNTLEDIPEGLEDHYKKQDDGTYRLKVEGAVAKSRLDEFRENNQKLMHELETSQSSLNSLEDQLKQVNTEVKEKYGNIDVEAYNEMLAKQKALKEKKLIEAGKHEELLKLREDELRNEFSRAQAELTKKMTESSDSYESQISKMNKQLSTLLIDNRLTGLATQYSVRPTAIQDVLARGKGTWSIENGDAIAYDGNGNRMYEADGTTLLTMETWMESLSQNAPHLFETSSGSGEDINIDSLFDNEDPNKNKSSTFDNPEWMVGPLADIKAGLKDL